MAILNLGDDFGGLAQLGQAIPAAIQGYQEAEDRKYKRLELAAKLAADKENRQTQELMNKIKLQEEGYDVDINKPLSGLLESGGLVRNQGHLSTKDLDRKYRIAQIESINAKTAQDRGLMGSEVNLEKKLPLDKKKKIEKLATTTAGKISIKNQIDSVLAGWDALPDDQKVAAGRQLIKTLNSTEGADAVGAEEARRLGGKLEFAFGNLTNSNPTQFGRDLQGFKVQAENVAKAIGGAVEANEAQIDKIYGRTHNSAPPAGGPPPLKTFKTNEIEWAD